MREDQPRKQALLPATTDQSSDMEEYLQNKYLAVVLVLMAGLAMGYLVYRPSFLYLKKRAGRRNLPYLGALANTLAKISWLLGVITGLNLLRLGVMGAMESAALEKAIQVVSTVILTYIAGEILVFLYDRYNAATRGAATSLYHILIRLFVYSSGLMFVFRVLGIEIAPILTALGVGGLAVALALQDTLSNLFAGVHILAAKQLQPGDYIQLESHEEGYVVDINWRNTVVRTRLQNIVIIPNSKIANSVITNYDTLQHTLYFHLVVGVHYDSDLERVEQITTEVLYQVLEAHGGVPENLTPRMRYFEFADSSINFRVWLTARDYERQFAIRHAFIKALKRRFDEEGIVIPFPIRTVYMEKSSSGSGEEG